MWRLLPDPLTGVSVKRNPGQTMHSQCGSGGYSSASIRMPRDHRKGIAHALEVKTVMDEGGILIVTVYAGGRQVWTGPTGNPNGLKGPMGVRTDAGVFRFRPQPKTEGRRGPKGCVALIVTSRSTSRRREFWTSMTITSDHACARTAGGLLENGDQPEHLQLPNAVMSGNFKTFCGFSGARRQGG
jgi:hypothetical protein